MVKIFGFLKSDSGVDWYRIKQPLIHIRASKEAEVRFFHKGDDFEWFGNTEATLKLNSDLEWADIIFVPRVSESKLTTVLREFQKLGKKIVTEWDDNLFAVSPLTQQYREFGQEEYSHEVFNEKTGQKEMLEIWKDGKNIDLARNRQNRKNMIEALEMSDLMMVTTKDLAEVYKPYAKNIAVAPNSVNINFWEKLSLRPHAGVRMGWFGGDTHYKDWCVIAPIMKSFMEQNPHVTLVLLGARFEGTLKGISPSRIEHHLWVDINAYPYKAAQLDLDFAVIPLEDNDFNNGKSPIKWLEMGSLQVPSVTSYVKPYQDMMDLIHENGIFVEANSIQGWWDGMNLLVSNPHLRQTMGLNARRTVEQFYDANKTWRVWLDAFEGLIKKPVLEIV